MHRLLVFACACSTATSSPRPPPKPEPPPRPDPVVDATCLDHIRAGTLADLPAEAGGFTITSTDSNIELHHDGKPIGDADGKRLWQGLETDIFRSGRGLSSGSSGAYSLERCADASPGGCFHFEAWTCQLDVADLATRIRATLDRLQLGDAGIAVYLKSNEAVGVKAIKTGGEPAQHYATHAHYDPTGARHSLHDGEGSCHADGECFGEHSNNCTAWYLLGGGETLLGIRHAEPWFCGCVEERCTWFRQ